MWTSKTKQNHKGLRVFLEEGYKHQPLGSLPSRDTRVRKGGKSVTITQIHHNKPPEPLSGPKSAWKLERSISLSQICLGLTI
jgi:hypothetical protein